jgi:hypothetical protein
VTIEPVLAVEPVRDVLVDDAADEGALLDVLVEPWRDGVTVL